MEYPIRPRLADDICETGPRLLTEEEIKSINKIKSYQLQEDIFLSMTNRRYMPYVRTNPAKAKRKI